MKGQSMCEAWEDILKNHVPPFDWGYPVNPKFAIIFSCPREHSLNTHKRNLNFKEVQRKTEYDTFKKRLQAYFKRIINIKLETKFSQ